jgi:hypothetical protein
VQVKSSADSEIRHTFDETEVKAFADHITTLVKGDPDLQSVLPITNDNLFEEVSKGVLLWYIMHFSISYHSKQDFKCDPTRSN